MSGTPALLDEATALEELVACGRKMVESGLSPGSSGNLSVRIGDRIHLTPTGARLDALEPDRLAVVPLRGSPEPAAPGTPRPSKEFPLHQALYQRDESTRAVVHVHSPHAVAWSCVPPWSERSAVPPLTPYFVMRVGQVPLVEYAPPGDPEQARQLAALRQPFRAALLQNHGPVTAGTTVEMAYEAAVELEETARLLLLLGDNERRLLDAQQVDELRQKYGTPWGPS